MSRKVKILSAVWLSVFALFVLIGPPGMVGLLGPEASSFGHTASVGLTVLFVALALALPVMVILWVVTFWRWVWASTAPRAPKRG